MRTDRNGTAATVRSILAATGVSLVLVGGFGCDEGDANEEQQPRAESPEPSGTEAPGPSAGTRDNDGDEASESADDQPPPKTSPKGMRRKSKRGEIEISEEDLENFARVQIRMKKFSESDEMQRHKQKKGRKAKVQRMAKMKEKATSVMDELGMDQERYARIGRRMREDRRLQMRLKKKIREIQSEKAGTDAG